jgi:hypothetical protein
MLEWSQRLWREPIGDVSTQWGLLSGTCIQHWSVIAEGQGTTDIMATVNPATTTLPAMQPAAAPAATNAAPGTAAATTVGNVIGQIDASRQQDAERSLAQAFLNPYSVGGVPTTTGQLTMNSSVNLLTRLYSARASRLSDISVALGDYMNKTGSVNHPALIKLQQEMAANDILNGLTKNLFEKGQQATNAWVQLRV